jgi:RNA polymerase sigma-70 factor, ECF subfamily
MAPSEPLEFATIYETWFDDVSRWVRALGGPAADRDDLVQDVFLIVYRRLHDFDGQNVAGWLYKIARRRVRDFRRLAWVKNLVGRRAPLSDALTGSTSTPAELLERKERSAELERMLETLSDDQRVAFVLFEIEGYSGEEIARVQGVPINTVWARIYKSRKKLQEQIVRSERRERRGQP